MDVLENAVTEKNALVEAEAFPTDDRVTYKDSTYEIVSKVAYLIGVPKRIFDNEHEAPKIEIYEKLDADKTARIIRHLCIIRTAIERNFKHINERMKFSYLSISSMPEYVPQDSLQQLNADGISFIKKSSTKLSQHIVEINKLISDRINNCKKLFPLWLNWLYVKNLFLMPDGLKEEGTKAAADNYFGDMKFRVQVANPPYSANWSADMHFMEDERFNEYGKLAPKSKADFAFVQHMVYHMDEDGRAVVLLPHGVLFRGAAEEVIRKHLIQKLNVLDAVIGLPANLFFGTGIPVCVLVLKRERNGNSDNILFIDASNDFEAGKNQNILRECDIDKIVETYEHRVDVDKYAHVATMQEIEENGFNLNIPRYVDTFEPEEEIDLNAVAAEIRNIQAEIKGIDAQLKPFFDELGLDFPFDVEGK